MWVCRLNFLLSVQKHSWSGAQRNSAVACSASLVTVVWPVLLKAAASATETYSNTGHKHANCNT